MIAGFFGMNLVSGFEEHPSLFYVACGGSAALMALCYTALAGPYLSGVAGGTSDDAETAELKLTKMKRFYAEVDSVGYKILHSALDREDLRRMYEQATDDAARAEEHTQEVYRLFDHDGDGLLSKHEVTRHAHDQAQGRESSFGATRPAAAAAAAAAAEQDAPVQRELSLRVGRTRPE